MVQELAGALKRERRTDRHKTLLAAPNVSSASFIAEIRLGINSCRFGQVRGLLPGIAVACGPIVGDALCSAQGDMPYFVSNNCVALAATVLLCLPSLSSKENDISASAGSVEFSGSGR